MIHGTKSLPDPKRWLVQQLGLVAFPQVSQMDSKEDWWQRVAGRSYDKKTETKRSVVYEGLIDNNKLTLTIDASTIRWASTPKLNAEGDSEQQWPTLGDYFESKESFSGLMNLWLDGMTPALTRLAFTAVLFQPVENETEANEIFSSYLTRIDIDPNSTDFLYRVNNRYNSKEVDGLQINRLMTWSLGQMELSVREISAGQPEETPKKRISDVCALVLDINTAPSDTRDVLPSDKVVYVFRELSAIGDNTVKSGDKTQ